MGGWTLSGPIQPVLTAFYDRQMKLVWPSGASQFIDSPDDLGDVNDYVCATLGGRVREPELTDEMIVRELRIQVQPNKGEMK